MPTYNEARNELDRLRRRGVDLTTTASPIEYESIERVRFQQGRRGMCQICGGARFIRFPFPAWHRWFGKSVPCPECNQEAM